MDLDRFWRLRPVLYHLTAAANLPRIHRTGCLEPAADLMRQAGRADLLRIRRPEMTPIAINGDTVLLRDQAPLHERNCSLHPGFTFEDLIELLNSFVYFWPGTSDGPIPAGRNHFARNARREEDAAVLAIATPRLLEANPTPKFCRFNSGAPRSNPRAGKPPRGPDTFLAAAHAPFTAGSVTEVVFPRRVKLPLGHMAVTPVHRWLEEPGAAMTA